MKGTTTDIVYTSFFEADEVGNNLVNVGSIENLLYGGLIDHGAKIKYKTFI